MLRMGSLAALVVAGACVAACGPEPAPAAPSSPPAPAASARRADPPREVPVEPALPSSAPLALVNAFGSEIMVPGAYADAAAQAADTRDGVLEVEVVDAADGTPVAGALVSGCGSVSGDALRLQTDDRGIARFEAAPAIWLGVVARDGAKDTFARRHDTAWKIVHGAGRVRLALPRTNWFRFRFDLPAGVAPPDRIELEYERQGSEGLVVAVPSLAGFWSLSEEHPRAIALPAGPCRVRFDFTFRQDLPSLLLTDVVGGEGERVIRLRERLPVAGSVVQGDARLRGAVLYPGAEVEIELRRRSGDSAIESVRFGGDGTVRRVSAHSDGTAHSEPALTTAERTSSNGAWSFRSPPFAPGTAFQLIARAHRGGEVVACGTVEDAVAGGPDVAVPLLPAATIRGAVRDAAGNALTTPVVVTASWACEAVSPQAVLSSTTSREDGTFELGGLPRVPVRVQAGGAFLPVYTPNPVELVAGERESVSLDTRPTLTLRGIIRDAATGRPLACNLQIQQATTEASGHGFQSHGDGRWFTPGLVPGLMRLVVVLDGDRVGEIEPVTITESTTDLSLRLP